MSNVGESIDGLVSDVDMLSFAIGYSFKQGEFNFYSKYLHR